MCIGLWDAIAYPVHPKIKPSRDGIFNMAEGFAKIKCKKGMSSPELRTFEFPFETLVLGSQEMETVRVRAETALDPACVALGVHGILAVHLATCSVNAARRNRLMKR
jgi:hypothetical protein